MPRRRARFTSGQPPPLLPLRSSASRHYRAARASAAAASSQEPARAPVVRGHTPSRRAPPPPAFRSARAPPGAACWASAFSPCARRAGCRGSGAPAPALRRAEPSRPAVCALQGGPLLPWAAGVAAGDGRPLPQRAQVPGLRGELWPLSRAGTARCPAAGCPPRPLPTYRAPTDCSARFAAAGCPAHLPCCWRVWAAGPRGDAAGAGRLHLLSELPSRVCGRRSGPGGDAGLSASIGEDAVPCPTGAVVSPLKKPEPHCSRR